MRRSHVAVAAALFALAALAPAAPGMFIKPMLEDIPIAKLIENLDKAAAKEPKDAKLRLNLARAYAMAYADKAETVKVWKDKEMQGAWFGFTPKFVPFTVKTTDDEAKQKAAEANLAKAIDTYKQVVELDSKNLTAKLGLAWCLDQAKKKDEAIKAYREVIEEGWMADKDRKSLPLGGHTITAEGAGYLIPLLDKTKDKEEIATLEDKVAKLKKLPRPVTPVVVPLRAGLTAKDMVNPRARVRFDADGFGFNDEWTWFTNDAGILVFDQHKRGKITSAIQWFGNTTFWMFWDNGYEALKSLDADGDGVLRGKELEGIAVWIDANGDGICQPGEVKSLTELGIVAISCHYEIDLSHPDRIAYSKIGVTFADGTTRPTFDVVLKKW
jgi:hypothetical protein